MDFLSQKRIEAVLMECTHEEDQTQHVLNTIHRSGYSADQLLLAGHPATQREVTSGNSPHCVIYPNLRITASHLHVGVGFVVRDFASFETDGTSERFQMQWLTECV